MNAKRYVRTAGALLLVVCGSVTGLWAQTGGAKVLHFPQDQSVGVVYIQDENIVVPEVSDGFNPGAMAVELENYCPAQGEVRIPPGKRVRLMIRGVGATPARCRMALESLGPDDLHGLDFFSMRPVPLSADLVPLIVRLTGLRRLSLASVQVSPKDLARIALLPVLEEIHPSVGLSDAGMAEIAKIQSLKKMDLSPDRMTNRGLALLGQLKSLEELHLYGNPAMTDDGLKALTNLRALRYLRLGKDGSFTDRGMEHLAAMPSLKVLWLDTLNVTDDGLRLLSKSRSLERLYIYWLSRVTDRGIAYLQGMPQLKGLNAGQAQLTDAALAHLAVMPNLDWLELPGGFTDAGIRSLTKLDRLEVLHINHADDSPLTDEALKVVCQIRSLKDLAIGGEGFTNDGIDMLAGLPSLETLDIRCPGFDNETLKHLAKLTKIRDLRWTPRGNVTLSGLNVLNRCTALETLCAGEVQQDGRGLDLSNLRSLKILAVAMRGQRTKVGDEIVYTSDAFQDSDLACLSRLTELESLSLNGPGIGDEGLRHLASLTRLKYLTIGGSANLTDDGLKYLAQMRRLDSLHIVRSGITDRGLEYLYPLKSLHILRIATGTPIGGQAIYRLRTELPHLQSLDLSQSEQIRSKPSAQPRIR